jgi:ketosteroid isomerase-like protein
MHAFISKLLGAVNAHDLDALVDCFAADYRNETPVHASRGFTGRDQVRRNWEQIFAFVPDIRADVLRATNDGETVWSEWEMRGTKRDRSPHLMRGVIVFGVHDARADWARFYLEPAEDTGEDVGEAVRRQVSPVREGM